MTFKALFFDLDDTLYDHLQPFETAIRGIFPGVYGKFDTQEIYKRFRFHSDQLWMDYSQKRISLEKLRECRIQFTLRDFGCLVTPETAFHFQSAYEIEGHNIELFSEVPHVFSKLHELGLMVGIITNGPITHQLNKIKTLGLMDLLPKDLIFISDKVGFAKPDSRIFFHVSKVTGISPNQVAFIGDSWKADIKGASSAGWLPIWLNHRNREPGEDVERFYTIESLKDVLDIIRRFEKVL